MNRKLCSFFWLQCQTLVALLWGDILKHELQMPDLSHVTMSSTAPCGVWGWHSACPALGGPCWTILGKDPHSKQFPLNAGCAVKCKNWPLESFWVTDVCSLKGSPISGHHLWVLLERGPACTSQMIAFSQRYLKGPVFSLG